MQRHKALITLIANPLSALLLLGTACGGDGPYYLSPYGESSLKIMVNEEKEVAFRVLTEDGHPVVGHSVRFAIEGGKPNGAVIDQLVVQVDEQGIAKTTLKAKRKAQFRIVGQADDAEDARIPVSVSKRNGGQLSVTVYYKAKPKADDITVRIVDGVPCNNFDPVIPPAGSTRVGNDEESASPNEEGDTVPFSGLEPERKYSVIGIATRKTQVVAAGCTDGIKMTQEDIENDATVSVALHVQDVISPIDRNALRCETAFERPLRFYRIARVFEQMVDDPGDPLEFIIERAINQSDYLTSIVGKSVLYQMKNEISSRDPHSKRSKAKLERLADKLAKIRDVKLFTSLKIRDADTKKDDKNKDKADFDGRLKADHSFKYFKANVAGRDEQYYLNQGTQSIFGKQSSAKIRDTLDVEVQEADRVFLDDHELSLPIADSILATMLIDEFQEYDLKSIFIGIADCKILSDQVLDWLEGKLPSYGIFDPIVIGKASIETACDDVLSDMLVEIKDEMLGDVKAAGLSENIPFRGVANVKMLPDGKTVGEMYNGEWDVVGEFECRRF